MRNDSRGPGTLISVGRALALLEILAEAPDGRGVTELARDLGVHKSSASRLLATLRGSGLVEVRAASGRFELGAGFLRLAARVVRDLDLPRLARPYLQELARRSGETANVSVRRGHSRVCIEEIESQNPVRMVAGVGHSYPLYAGAPSKVLLAWLREPEVEEILRSMPADAHRTAEQRRAGMLAELAEVRDRGYALSFEENIPGASSVAVPIRSHLGLVTAALSVAGVAQRWDRSRMLAFLPAMQRSADAIARLLGHARAAYDEAPREGPGSLDHVLTGKGGVRGVR